MTRTRGTRRASTGPTDASSTSNTPTSPRSSPPQVESATRAAAIPRSRFEPERLCTGSQPAARTMSDTIRAVVVFPFVPETQTEPWASAPARWPIASGSIARVTIPGSAVAPRPRTWSPKRVSLPAPTAVTRSASATRGTLGAGRLDLAEQELELVDRATEPQGEGLRDIAVRARVLERALGLEAREQRDRAAEPGDRERRGQRAPELRDARLELLEPPPELVLEVLVRERFEPFHLGLERSEVAGHDLRGLLEGVALLEGLADPDDLLHREDVVVVIVVRRGLHEAFLRPVDELPRGHVADPRGLRGGQAEPLDDLAVVRDKGLGQDVLVALRHGAPLLDPATVRSQEATSVLAAAERVKNEDRWLIPDHDRGRR